MKLKKLTIISLVMILSLMVGCSGTENSTYTSGKSSDEKVLVYGSTDYTSINPALYEHGEINSLIFSKFSSSLYFRLFKYNSKGLYAWETI